MKAIAQYNSQLPWTVLRVTYDVGLRISIIIFTEGNADLEYQHKPAVKEAICRITPYRHTRRTESFHSMIFKFAPKHQSIGCYAMISKFFEFLSIF